MAGDWIKMRDNLWDDPRVSEICDITGATEATVIGGLYWLWSNADQHSVDGKLAGVTVATIDRKTKIKGFGKALIAAGWLAEVERGVAIPRFEEHNGESAKTRAEGQKRKANWRSRTGQMSHETRDKCPVGSGTNVPQNAGQIGDKREAREEKRREELLTPGESEDTSSPATRLPHHWQPGSDLVSWTRETRPQWSDDDLGREVAQFRDHYTGTGDKRADWDATWRKWVRGSRAAHRGSGTGIRTDPAAMDLLLGNVDAAH